MIVIAVKGHEWMFSSFPSSQHVSPIFLSQNAEPQTFDSLNCVTVDLELGRSLVVLHRSFSVERVKACRRLSGCTVVLTGVVPCRDQKDVSLSWNCMNGSCKSSRFCLSPTCELLLLHSFVVYSWQPVP